MKRIFRPPENKAEAAVHLIFCDLIFITKDFWWPPSSKFLSELFSPYVYGHVLFLSTFFFLVFFGWSVFYVRAAKFFILNKKINISRLLFFYLLSWVTMSTYFLSGAEGIDFAFFEFKDIVLGLDNFYKFFATIWLFLIFNLIFKTWCLQDIDKRTCAENIAGIFSGTGIILWAALIFYRNGQEKDFVNATFNHNANDFVWYTFWSTTILLSYLLSIKLDKHARAVVDADL
jgi:hypothetical protein